LLPAGEEDEEDGGDVTAVITVENMNGSQSVTGNELLTEQLRPGTSSSIPAGSFTHIPAAAAAPRGPVEMMMMVMMTSG